MSEMSSKPTGGLITYLLLLIAHVAFVFWLPYLPTQDGPSHLYNLVILQDLLNGGKEWGNFFSYDLRALPNLGFMLFAYPLLHFFSPLIVERIFVSLYIILIGVSVPVFLRTFNKQPLPVSYFIFPVIFNYTFLMGFYNYIIAVPLFLLSFSLAWRTRKGPIVLQFICYNLSGLIIYYVHLIPFVFFILSLIIITIVESNTSKERIINLLRLALVTAPCIMNLIYYFRLGTSRSLPDLSYLLSLSRHARLLAGLFYFSTFNFLWQILPASLFMIFIVLLAYHSTKDILKRKLKSEDILPSEKALIYLALSLLLIFLVAPSNFGGGALFNERLPWIILLISLPLLQIPESMTLKRLTSFAVIITVSIFFIFNVVILWQQSNKVEKFLRGLQAEPPRGAFLMTYKPKIQQGTTVDTLLHAASYYGIFRGCVDIGNYETATDLFPVKFKKTMPAMPPEKQISYKPTSIVLADYPDIEYLLGWEIDNKEKEGLTKYFQLILEEDQFSMWQKKGV